MRSPPEREALVDALTGLLSSGFDDMVDLRRTLHANPELSFAEYETTALVRAHLASTGLQDLPCPTKTGAVVLLEGGRPGNTVLLRADIDALPVHEEVDLPFRSLRDGCMHACGHDAHTAVLLGVASALSHLAEDLPGRYLFVFQPAEEVLGGAKAMIEGGMLDGLAVKVVLGWHVASVLPVGSVYVRPGPILSEGVGFRAVLRGGGGHGAFGAPSSVIDAVSELVRCLPRVVEGMEYEGTRCACSAGVIHAGTALNVVPAVATLEGTVRTFTPGQREEARARLLSCCQGVADSAGIEVDLQYTVHAPLVANDPHVTETVSAAAKRHVGQGVVTGPPLPPSDDFGEFMKLVPGCFFLVGGQRADGTSGMHHSPMFALDEDALAVGCRVMAQAAMDLASERFQ